jgi:hypothetical protein
LHTGKELDNEVRHPIGNGRRQVVLVITIVAAGIGIILVVAVIVGIVDAAQAAAWRRVAAERRETWEAKQPEFHGVDTVDTADTDDD